MNTIKLVKQDYKDIMNNKDWYEVEGVECMYVAVTADLDEWVATVYEGADTVIYQTWAQTPHLAGDKALKNFDLCLGMEVA